MATYKSDMITSNGPRSVHGDAREGQRFISYTTLTTGLLTNDIIQLGYLPPNAVVEGISIQATAQLDTNGTPTLSFNVGDNGYTGVAADTQRYASAVTVGRTAAGTDGNGFGTLNGRARLFKNTSGANLLVFATVTAGAATGAPGALAVGLSYFVDEPQSSLNQ